jgi:hypothetical protein
LAETNGEENKKKMVKKIKENRESVKTQEQKVDSIAEELKKSDVNVEKAMKARVLMR